MRTHRIFSLAVIAAIIPVVSCAAPVTPTLAPAQSALQIPSPTPSVAQPTASTQPTVATAVPTKAAAQPTGTAKINMDEIFPPGPGREAMLDNCTSCHTFVPMVVLQMSQSQWDRNAMDHRDRVPRMSDGDFKAAYTYLAKNFNPDRPVPKLPKELLDTWTDY